MGYYSEYLNMRMDFDEITRERKKQLSRISALRGGREVLVYAGDLSKSSQANGLDYTDILPMYDHISTLRGDKLDLILETPGGSGEVVEDLVCQIRDKFDHVGIIIPGWCKSAGTIFTMAGDEILMGDTSSLGPIDAQIYHQNHWVSAEAILKGFDAVKKDFEKNQKLNGAYIPILQALSIGLIEECDNVQSFSKQLVGKWLSEYKFKYWEQHRDGRAVTQDEKKKRASEIAEKLSSHSNSLTHGRSFKKQELEGIGLKIVDFSSNDELNEAIMKYYSLLRMTFDTNIFKIYETKDAQIYRFVIEPNQTIKPPPKNIFIDFNCPNCRNITKLQLNFIPNCDLISGHYPYPLDDDLFECPICRKKTNLRETKIKLEKEYGKLYK